MPAEGACFRPEVNKIRANHTGDEKMAFLLNKESEEEFDAEGDRYEELR